jgi:TctA family transporter
MLESILVALQLLLTPKAMLFLALGVVVGLLFGVMPGLGGLMAARYDARCALSA